MCWCDVNTDPASRIEYIPKPYTEDCDVAIWFVYFLISMERLNCINYEDIIMDMKEYRIYYKEAE